MAHPISSKDVKKARQVFEANEPRDLFYRAATELVDLALRGATSLTVAEALAVLLQTWNRPYYQYRKFDLAHFAKIDTLLRAHEIELTAYRNRSIDGLKLGEEAAIVNLFQAFESVMGPVGAAKSLHLLAPSLFPLWDRKIAVAYNLTLGVSGHNGNRYWQFLLVAQQQCSALSSGRSEGRNLLKSIDEYNYCRYTKNWL